MGKDIGRQEDGDSDGCRLETKIKMKLATSLWFNQFMEKLTRCFVKDIAMPHYHFLNRLKP